LNSIKNEGLPALIRHENTSLTEIANSLNILITYKTQPL